MMGRLRVTALQLPARFGAVRQQLAFAEALLESGPATDLVLLPEASLTGYLSPEGDFDLTPFAEPPDGPTAAAFQHLARRFDCLVAGPLIERAGDCCFNALVGYRPDGSNLFHYRKRHPWFPEEWATPGAEPGALALWRGATLLPALCYDGHFLEQEAADRLDAAGLLLFASAWVDASDSMLPLLAGLAGDHQLSVLNANWGRGQPRVQGQGGSLFLDASGALVARLGLEPGRLDAVLPLF